MRSALLSLLGFTVAALIGACPGDNARACSSNGDCEGGEVCVLVDGKGTCGVLDPNPDPDAGFIPDAGPNDAGPSDAGPTTFSITSGVVPGASTARSGATRLRARVRAAEQNVTSSGGDLSFSPPRR